MFCAVLILNYNNYQDTIQCVDSILKYNTAPVKFVVVDNGSQERGCIDALDRYFRNRFQTDYQRLGQDAPVIRDLPKLTFVVNSSNEGYARGNNMGLRFIFADETIEDILVVNNDILFVEDIIPALKDKRAHLDRCGVVSPLLYHKDAKSIEYNCARKAPTHWEIILPFLFMKRDCFGYISRTSDKQKLLKTNPELINEAFFPIDLPSGSCMMVDKKLFESLHGFDPETFLYYEENILFAQLTQKGLVNYCVPKAECIHLGGASTRSSSSSFLQLYNLESADHYLKNYCRMTVAERCIWGLTKRMFRSRIKLMNFIKDRL